ncbi:alpha/beta-hydrolase [Byssothecium circinans]|uniref:Alpha/beta-hydrolase n=1 Tax=Byssothecium circinans TaxID=147558 RepID=A0A6A5UHP2_9PLEO|nr:alpha/beta-hydrolase [Byssothecium circinans]
MAPLADTTGATRFDNFNIYRTSFKSIGDHKIDVGILVPKGIKSSRKVPVVVNFHGGGLVSGDCLYANWKAAFWIPFLHRNNAITVLPNYRLVPEATGNDILGDLADFWTWFRGHGVERYLASQSSHVELDYEHVLASGDSAGGYMALQSGLTLPKGEIKVVLAQYPMTNYARRSPTDMPLGKRAPPHSFLNEYIASMTPGYITSSSNPSTEPQRGELSRALNAYNRFNEFFGLGKHLWPITTIESAHHLPPTTIFHGSDDTLVPVEDSKVFVDKVRGLEKFKDTELRLVVREGKEHGFDIDMKEDEEAWRKEELQWIERKWLA